MSAPAVLDPPADARRGRTDDAEPLTLSPALSARVRRELAASDFEDASALLWAALNVRQVVVRGAERTPVIHDPDGIPLAEVRQEVIERYGFLEDEGLIPPGARDV